MITLTFPVTQEDIDHGRMSDCYNCPVALALRRAINQSVSVGWQHITYWLGQSVMWATDVYVSLDTPRDMRRWLIDFDAGEPVSPSWFTLDITPYLQMQERYETHPPKARRFPYR